MNTCNMNREEVFAADIIILSIDSLMLIFSATKSI